VLIVNHLVYHSEIQDNNIYIKNGYNFFWWEYNKKVIKMETIEIIRQIEQLPIDQRILIIEKTLKLIREREIKEKMSKAVEELHEEYKTDKNLTAFTDIDCDSFYETK